MVRKLAPAEFAQERLRALAARLRAARLVPDRARTDLAEMQMRRQERRAVHAGFVARSRVVHDAAIEKLMEPFQRAALSGRPAIANARVPADARQQCQRVDRFRAGPGIRYAEWVRRRKRPRGFRARHARLPEWREHAVRLVLLRRNFPRLEQQRALVRLRAQARIGQRRFHSLVALDRLRSVPAVPVHLGRAGLGRQTAQRIE